VLLAVDRFMSEVRAITNLIGNTLATLVIARWEGTLDAARARMVLNGQPVDGADRVDRAIEPATVCDISAVEGRL